MLEEKLELANNAFQKSVQQEEKFGQLLRSDQISMFCEQYANAGVELPTSITSEGAEGDLTKKNQRLQRRLAHDQRNSMKKEIEGYRSGYSTDSDYEYEKGAKASFGDAQVALHAAALEILGDVDDEYKSIPHIYRMVMNYQKIFNISNQASLISIFYQAITCLARLDVIGYDPLGLCSPQGLYRNDPVFLNLPCY